MILLCINCDMEFRGRKPEGWHGVKKLRTLKEATTIETVPLQVVRDESGIRYIIGEHENLDDWWTHEGWCPDCVKEGKCGCGKCCGVKVQGELFGEIK